MAESRKPGTLDARAEPRPEALLSSLKLTPITARYTVVDKEWHGSVPHADVFARLYLVTGGRGALTLQGLRRELVPGRFYLVPSGVVFNHHPSQGLAHFWVHFTAEVLGGMSLFRFLRCSFEREPVPSQAEERLMERLAGLEGWSSPASQVAARGILGLLLSAFLEEETVLAPPGLRGIERFAPAIAFIREHLHKPVSTAALAALVNLNPTYFANEFSRFFGMPPRRYILTRRVERAQVFLWSTAEPLKRISEACGFPDTAYFSRVFLRITGVTPGKYRAMRERLVTPPRA